MGLSVGFEENSIHVIGFCCFFSCVSKIHKEFQWNKVNICKKKNTHTHTFIYSIINNSVKVKNVDFFSFIILILFSYSSPVNCVCIEFGGCKTSSKDSEKRNSERKSISLLKSSPEDIAIQEIIQLNPMCDDCTSTRVLEYPASSQSPNPQTALLHLHSLE